MATPASKVKSVCNASETALVRNSRKPNLEQHSKSELQKLAAQARKHFDKWQGLARDQSRSKGKKVGSAEADKNTRLKVQIFREALDNFVARLAKVAGSSEQPAGKSKAKTPKRARSAEHRAGRAEIRKELDQTRIKKSKPRVTKKPAAEKPPQSAALAEGASIDSLELAPVPRKKPARRPAPAISHPSSGPEIHPGRQLRAATVAKQARVAQSGLTTRVRGHVSARGRRKQARRDSMN
jgi:hypothetical protein